MSRSKEYQTAKSRREKSRIVYGVVQHVHNYGGRFLKKEKNAAWRIVSTTEAIQKVGHSLRDKKQHLKRGKTLSSNMPAVRVQSNLSSNSQLTASKATEASDLLLQLGQVCATAMDEKKSNNNNNKSKGPPRKRHKGGTRASAKKAKSRPLPVITLGAEDEACARAIIQMSRGGFFSAENKMAAADHDNDTASATSTEAGVEPPQQIVTHSQAGTATSSKHFDLNGIHQERATLPPSSFITKQQQPAGDGTAEQMSAAEQQHALLASLVNEQLLAAVKNKVEQASQQEQTLAAAAADFIIRRHQQQAAAEKALHTALFQQQQQQKSASPFALPEFNFLNPAWRHFANPLGGGGASWASQS